MRSGLGGQEACLLGVGAEGLPVERPPGGRELRHEQLSTYAAGVADNGAVGRSHELESWDADLKWHPARRQAFLAYRDMPDRSIRAVAQALGKSSTLIGRWSSEDGWPGRVAGWEAECDRRRREEFHDAGADVARAQAEAAAQLRAVLLAPGRVLAARIDRMRREGGGEPFQDLSLAEVARLAITAARVFAPVAQAERAALGLGGGEGGSPVDREIERKTTAELEEYLTGRRGSRDSPGGRASAANGGVEHGRNPAKVAAHPQDRTRC
jgi:hypothetical protein